MTAVHGSIIGSPTAVRKFFSSSPPRCLAQTIPPRWSLSKSCCVLSVHGRRSIRHVVGPPHVRASASSAYPVSGGDPPPGLHKALQETARKLKGSAAAPASDIVWTAAGGLVAILGLEAMEYFLAPKGIKVNIGSFAAVATVLFVSPSAPAAQKFNVFVAHIGCALISVLLLLLLGVTPLTKAVAVAACVVFMLFTSSLHPPASGLPLIFMDSPKL